MIPKHILLITQAFESVGESCSIKEAHNVFSSLTSNTRNLYDRGLYDEFKQAVLLEKNRSFSSKHIAQSSMLEMVNVIEELMYKNHISKEKISQRTGLSMTVLEGLFVHAQASAINMIQVLHAVGVDTWTRDWKDKFPAVVEPSVRADVRLLPVQKFMYDRLQSHSIQELLPMEALGSELEPFDYNLQKDGELIIKGNLLRNDDPTSIFNRSLPLIVAFSPEAFESLKRMYYQDPNAKVIAIGNTFVTAKGVLEYSTIKSTDDEDDCRYMVLSFPYRVSAMGDSLVNDKTDIVVQLDGIYSTSIKYENVSYYEEETDEDEIDNPGDGDGGNGEGEIDTGGEGEPEPTIPDGGDTDEGTDGAPEIPGDTNITDEGEPEPTIPDGGDIDEGTENIPTTPKDTDTTDEGTTGEGITDGGSGQGNDSPDVGELPSNPDTGDTDGETIDNGPTDEHDNGTSGSSDNGGGTNVVNGGEEGENPTDLDEPTSPPEGTEPEGTIDDGVNEGTVGGDGEKQSDNGDGLPDGESTKEEGHEPSQP